MENSIYEEEVIQSENIGRNKFITFWLWLLIIVGTLSAIYSSCKLFNGGIIENDFYSFYVHTVTNNGFVLTMAVLPLLLTTLQVFGLVKLLTRKSVGFKLVLLAQIAYVVTTQVCMYGLMMFSGYLFMLQCLQVIIYLTVLRGVLSLKKGGVSYWDTLD